MSLVKKVKGAVKKVVEVIRRLVTRPGMDDFIERWAQDAARELSWYIARHGLRGGLREWWDEGFLLIKSLTGQQKDTWVSILLLLAYDMFKAGQEKAED
jgi:hypothetical protein